MREEVDHAIRRDLSEIRDLAKLLDRSLTASRKTAVALGQSLCRDLAHVSNAQRVDKAFQSRLLRARDRIHQILRGFLSHTFKSGDLLDRERIEIRRIGDQVRLKQRIHDLRTKAVNVHGVLGGKMLDPTGKLCGTAAVRAACGRPLVRVVKDGLTAGGATLGHEELTRVG